MAERQIRVLVIEDDEYSRDALAHLLAAEGYDAQSAHDGEAGIDKARKINPDVIVLDLNLPGIDGKQVIKMIRGDQSLASIPILVVTGDDDKEAQAAVQMGADGYLTKPLEFDALISAITNIQASSLIER
jgi:DNA-binding response OmpR family regulator